MKINLTRITFEITSECNLDCSYCYNVWKRSEDKSYTSSTYQKARKTLKKLFAQANIDQVVFTGGEPFLSERFAEIVLFTRMKKKHVSIISNGNIATSKDYKIMLDMGVELFEFPILSSNRKEHDSLTGKENSWKASVNSAKEVLKMGGRVVPVVIITKINYNSIKETLLFLKNLGMKQIMLNRFNIGGNGIAKINELLVSREQLNETLKTANNIAIEHKLSISSNVCTPICILNPNDYSNIFFTSCSKDVLRKPITMDIEGNIRICNHSPHIMGNIFKENIKQILNSEYANKWGHEIPEQCDMCDLYEKCLGGCRAAAEQMGLGLNHADPILNMMK